MVDDPTASTEELNTELMKRYLQILQIP